MNAHGEHDIPLRVVQDHIVTDDGYHEWVTLGERVRANRLGVGNPRMWDARWTKWVCNSGSCPAFAFVSDDAVKAMLEAAESPTSRTGSRATLNVCTVVPISR